MPSVFVADASPLILLAGIGQLGLLGCLTEGVLVPEAVDREVRSGADAAFLARLAEAAAWLRLVPDMTLPASVVRWNLGDGESQVLAYGVARPECELVLDDRAGRRCAKSLGLPVTGTLGIVLRSRRAGHIPAARPVLDALLAIGFYLSPEAQDLALAEVGE